MLNKTSSGIFKSNSNKIIDKALKYTVTANQFVSPIIVLDPTNNFIDKLHGVVYDYRSIWILPCDRTEEDAESTLLQLLNSITTDSIVLINHAELICKNTLKGFSRAIKNCNHNVSVLLTQSVSDNEAILVEQNKITDSIVDMLGVENCVNSPDNKSYLIIATQNKKVYTKVVQARSLF